MIVWRDVPETESLYNVELSQKLRLEGVVRAAVVQLDRVRIVLPPTSFDLVTPEL